MLGEMTAPTPLSLIDCVFSAICWSVNPVVPTTRFTPDSAVVFIVSTAALAMVKSIRTSGFLDSRVSLSFSAPTIGILIGPIPITSPTSFPCRGV